MTEEEFKTLSPAEREMFQIVTGALASIMQYLNALTMRLDEIEGRGGSLVYTKEPDARWYVTQFRKRKAAQPSLTMQRFADDYGLNYDQFRMMVRRAEQKEASKPNSTEQNRSVDVR